MEAGKGHTTVTPRTRPLGRPRCYRHGRGARVGSVGFSGRGGADTGNYSQYPLPHGPRCSVPLAAFVTCPGASTPPQQVPVSLGVRQTMRPPKKSQRPRGTTSNGIPPWGVKVSFCTWKDTPKPHSTIRRRGGQGADGEAAMAPSGAKAAPRPSPPPPASPRTCPDDTNDVLRRVATAPGGYP